MAVGDDETGKLVVVGALMGAHGVRGDVKVRSFTAAPEDVFAYGPLLAGDGAVLLEAAAVRAAGAHFIVTPATPRTREDWEALKGARLHVPRAAMPAAEEGEFYVEDLVGLAVFAGGNRPVGRITAVQDFGAGDLLEVQPAADGKRVLIPFTRQDVPTVDLAAQRIVVASWELWTEDSEA